MIIHEIFEILLANGVVANQCEYSRNFLGKSARYYSYVLATRCTVPVEVLVGLSIRLEWLADAQIELDSAGKGESRYRELSERVREAAVRQSIATLPRSRSRASRITAL